MSKHATAGVWMSKKKVDLNILTFFCPNKQRHTLVYCRGNIRVDAVVMNCWCNWQLVVWAFIVILLSSLLFIWNNCVCQLPASYTSTASNISNRSITPGLLYYVYFSMFLSISFDLLVAMQPQSEVNWYNVILFHTYKRWLNSNMVHPFCNFFVWWVETR